MDNSNPCVLVAVEDATVYVKLRGVANVMLSVAFKRLLVRLRQRGMTRYVLDLSDCLIMDSTFLGVVALQGIELSRDNGEAGPEPITLINSNPRIRGLLENLGVLERFRMVDMKDRAGGHEYRRLEKDGRAIERNDVTATSLEAHQTLMALNPENAARFKDVTRFLEEDLKRHNQ